MAESWKIIPDTKGLYLISDKGDIKRDGKILKHLLARGYHYISLSIDGKMIRKSVHRLVAKLFIPNPLNKPEVNHIDGNKDNNNKDNLEWVTPSENQRHRYDVLNKYIDPASSPRSIKVRCINDNKIFKSLREACRCYNIDNSWVSKLFKIKNKIKVKNIELEKLEKEDK